MKRNLLLILGLVGVVAVIALVAYVVLHMHPATPNTGSIDPFGNIGNGNPGEGGSYTRDLRGTDGSVYHIPDYTQGHPSFDEAGETYYTVTEDTAQQEESDAYSIVIGSDSTISIGLTAEPLGKARADAEARLRELVPLSNAELCTLTVTVMASPRVNETYAGVDLGLSFCPGAVQLP
jgi:hypothetical protein